MQKYAFYCLLIVLLAACQGRPGQGELYVYTDPQGNLVTIEKPSQQKTAETARKAENQILEEPLEGYRPSEEIDRELEEKERDRFITYIDGSGQLVSRQAK